MKKNIIFVGFVFAVFASSALAWRSSLYPEDWLPPGPEKLFYEDAFLQDFSYAGYKRGEEPIPEVTGPIYDVTDPAYGADPTGTNDSTAAIQDAIDDAAAAGGGVVYLPAGKYLVEPEGSNNYALRIWASDVVLRGAGVGETFVLNTSYEMRGKRVISVAPTSTSSGSSVSFTADLEGPTRRIPVEDAGEFSEGDIVRMSWDFTQAWIDEHDQGEWWSEESGPSPAEYLREVLLVNTEEGWIDVDIPTRYTMKVRDNARVFRRTGMLTGVGLEDFSIGNVQHPGSGFGNNEYHTEGTAAYDAHASWLIRIEHAYDSWVSGVHSFQAADNTTTCHMLSNGLALSRAFRVTVRDVEMRRAQYGGGGGNGYMFRVQRANDNLLEDGIADFSRHGIVVSHAGTSGNVFRRMEDRETERATGDTGQYSPNSRGSDHHMHFSHSNLFDQSRAHNSVYLAAHRRNFGTIGHGLTSAHGVYWNMHGSGTRFPNVVSSQQGRYGYVIGTSGPRGGVNIQDPNQFNTLPEDIAEGVGLGETLEPQSLSEDQFAKRMQGVLVSIDLPEESLISPTEAYPLPGRAYTYGSGPVSSRWEKISGPSVSFADTHAIDTTVDLLQTGTYELQLTAWDGGVTNEASVTITVEDFVTLPAPHDLSHFIRGQAQDEEARPLGYFSNANGLVGTAGSSGERYDQNPVFGFELPSLPAGGTIDRATFTFDITQARDSSGASNIPDLHVYLLDVNDPTTTGTDFFYHGALDESSLVERIGVTNVTISGTGQNDFNPPIEFTFELDEDALAFLQDFYDGSEPNRSHAYFRFNMSELPSLGGWRRYGVSEGIGDSAFTLFSESGVLNVLTAADISDTDATLRSTLSAVGTNYTVHAYWGPTDGGTNAASWAQSAELGTWSDVAFTNINHQVSDLAPSTDYWFTFSASNDDGVVWAGDSMPFTTLGPPVVTQEPGAMSQTQNSASLRGELTAGESAQVWIGWGKQDAGTADTNAWDNLVYLGEIEEGDTFSTTVSGLEENRTYWYRIYAVNTYGTSWSPTAVAFSGSPAVSAGLWEPAELLPTGWYDASDLGTITASEGAVSEWEDRSGNDNHLMQDSSDHQPTSGTSMINGLNVLDFSEDYIFTETGLGADIYTVFMVTSNNIEITSSTDDMLLLSTAGDEVSTGDGFGDSTGALDNQVLAVFDEITPNTYQRRQGVSSAALPSIPVGTHMYTYALDSDWFIGFNGSDDLRDLTSGDGRSPMLFADSFSIGAGARRHPSDVEFFYDGSVGEVILLDRSVTEEERQRVEGYLAHKWGVTTSLPETHPYKTRSPGGEPIANLSPESISASQAALRGSIDAEGTNYTVWVHWGASDGGTNVGAWAQSEALGSFADVATNLHYSAEGLSSDTTYWYAFRAVSDDGEAWAQPSWQFATLPAGGGVTPEQLRVTGVTFEGGSIRLRTGQDWGSAGPPTIVIQMRTNLLDGVWEDAGEFTPDAENDEWSWTDMDVPSAFFRFSVTNAPVGP